MLKKFISGLLSGLIIMLLLLGGSWLALNWYANQPVLTTIKQDFIIEEGDSLTAISQNLASQGIIEYPKVFSILGRLLDLSGSLHVGDYLITPKTSVRELLDMFSQGKVRYYDVTLVEALRFSDILKELNQHPKLTEPLTQYDAKQLFKALGIKGSPEGLFYPDTYFFQSGASVKSILIRAHERLEKVLKEEWVARDMGLPYKTPYQALIMASVIEKETGAAFERPDIAGVFVRRLRLGMRLQSDPTVIYGMGNSYHGKLTRRILRTKTPYNTYVIKGLPPTPIATVGREAIHAALHPAAGKALYFVAKGDGTHYFSESLEEHNRAVRKYQITDRRSDYRSTIEKN
ncbi:MAG: endolytic transglycosylase MltG [Endozoicomonas sp. (ex Botrylloides leachii)]|nr:endolytic transglycosylase MltG [Endozoicomonas sp. (ex Botrylloides leachii)]